MTAILLPVLIGFAGLALDLGRLYIEKTELQNAMDACALAASRELTCDPSAGPCAASLLVNAENRGLFVAARNNIDFQRTAVSLSAEDIRFSTTFAPNSSYRSRAAGADPASKFVMCTAQQSGIVPWFMQVLGAGPQTVSAQAVATLVPSQANCGIPLGMCSQGPAGGSPPFGLVRGNWYDGRFDSGGGSTGSFNWIDYSPPSGGASELSALLAGSGVCNTNVSNPVGQSGVLGGAAARAWNSRFGLYRGGEGGPTVDTAPPDYTGYSYTPTNWPGSNALGDFMSRRNTNASYNGADLPGYNPTTPSQHATKGADRRLVVAPIMDCADWAANNVAPIRGFACVLMLNPIASPNDVVYMEYLGQSNEPNSPCATSGVVGGPGSGGPLVPALVQ